MFFFFMMLAFLDDVDLEFPLLMPGVTPELPNSESYLCTGAAVPDEPLYITGEV